MVELSPGPPHPPCCPTLSLAGAPLPEGFTTGGVLCSPALAPSQESGFLLGRVGGVCGFNCGWGGLERMQGDGGRTGPTPRKFPLVSLGRQQLCWVEPPVLSAGPQVVRGLLGMRKGSKGPSFGPGPLWSRQGLASRSRGEADGEPGGTGRNFSFHFRTQGFTLAAAVGPARFVWQATDFSSPGSACPLRPQWCLNYCPCPHFYPSLGDLLELPSFE